MAGSRGRNRNLDLGWNDLWADLWVVGYGHLELDPNGDLIGSCAFKKQGTKFAVLTVGYFAQMPTEIGRWAWPLGIGKRPHNLSPYYGPGKRFLKVPVCP